MVFEFEFTYPMTGKVLANGKNFMRQVKRSGNNFVFSYGSYRSDRNFGGNIAVVTMGDAFVQTNSNQRRRTLLKMCSSTHLLKLGPVVLKQYTLCTQVFNFVEFLFSIIYTHH